MTDTRFAQVIEAAAAHGSRFMAAVEKSVAGLAPAATRFEAAIAHAFQAAIGKRASAPAKARTGGFDAGRHPRHPKGSPKGGQFASAADLAGAMAAAGAPAGGRTQAKVTLKPAKGRAFTGAPAQIPDKAKLGGPGRQHEVGAHTEKLAVAHLETNRKHVAVELKQKGKADSFPFDVASYRHGEGVTLWEVKGGQSSNAISAQQWRITNDAKIADKHLKELKAIARRTKRPLADVKREFQASRIHAAIARKHQVAAEIQKSLRASGVLAPHETVKVKTLTAIFNDHTKQSDFFEFNGLHANIQWRSTTAQRAYVGSYKYEIKKGSRSIQQLADEAATMDAERWAKTHNDVVDTIGKLVDRAKPRRSAAAPGERTGAAVAGQNVAYEVQVTKVAAPQRFFMGWATVCTHQGTVVEDRQGDVITEDEMERYAHAFMRDARVGKLMHAGNEEIDYVVSMPLTAEVKKAFGITMQPDRTGWIVGGYVRDPEVFKRVQSGELRTLSIGGTGIRVPYESQ